MMNRASLSALALILGIAGTSQATLSVSVTSAPTTDLAGFTTFTLNLDTDVATITSLEGDFNGPMNQVNPFTLGTIFTDNNVAFGGAGASVDQDSQFLFSATGDSLIVVPGFSESGTNLNASFTGFAAFTNRDVAQIVVQDGQSVGYNITAVVDGQEELVSGTLTIPEPSSLALLGLGGLLIARRRRG